MFKFLIAMAVILITSTAGQAQQLQGCSLTEGTDPPRQILTCGGGLVIDAEVKALLQSQSGLAAGFTLKKGAVFIDLPRNTGPFQILTPHAIASVRGTVFVVDVGARDTVVFVVEGSVEVTTREGADSVILDKGDGASVSEGYPIIASHWSETKTNRLLARFGR